PARDPLHDRARAVGAAEHEVVAPRLRQRRLDRGTPARHLAFAEARIFGVNDTAQSRRQVRQRRNGHATTAGFAATLSCTNFASVTRSTLPEPSTGILSRIMISDGSISSAAPRSRAKAWNWERVASFCWVARISRSPLRASATA